MKNFKFNIFLFFLSIHFTACQPELVDADYLITNVNLVDIENGAINPAKYVAIKGEKIAAIYNKEVALKKSGQVIEGSGQYLIPGLWDMHAHFSLNHRFATPLLVANGITGVREMWGIMSTIKTIRQKVAADSLIAPDIYAAGDIIDGDPPTWPWSASVKNKEEAEAEVIRQDNQGVDFIKIYSRLSEDCYQAIAQKSKELDLPFAGHLPHSMSIWDAIQMDQQSIEHMNGVLEACTDQPEELQNLTGKSKSEKALFLVRSFDQYKFDSLANFLARSNTWICPTLSVLKFTSTMPDASWMNDSRLKYLPEQIQKMWQPDKTNIDTSFFEAYEKMFQLQSSLTGKLAGKGVKILAGTDFPNSFCYPGFSLHDELQLMVENGLSPAMALKSATLNPAIFMGKEKEVGKIAEGYRSNLVLLKANPLEDIRNTKKINAVFIRGKYLNSADLNAFLEKARGISAETK